MTTKNTPIPTHLKLIYHPMSPFSRKVYMQAIELGLSHLISLKQVVVAPVTMQGWSDDNDFVARFNPFAKIPTLIIPKSTDSWSEADYDEDTSMGVFDSRGICAYLSSIAPAGKAVPYDVRTETLHAIADGILDAQVLLVYEKHIRAAADPPVDYPPWAEGQKGKISRGLNHLEKLARKGGLPRRGADETASAGEVAVAAALKFMSVCEWQWEDGRPALAQWLQSCWAERKSLKGTRPELDWKTGQPKDLGIAAQVVSATIS